MAEQPMTLKQAIKIACEAIDREKKPIAFDAKLAEAMGGAANPTQQNRLDRYRKLEAAKAVLLDHASGKD